MNDCLIESCEMALQISRTQGEMAALQFNIQYVETSAKQNVNVEEVFMKLGESIVRDHAWNIDRDRNELNLNAAPNKKACCK